MLACLGLIRPKPDRFPQGLFCARELLGILQDLADMLQGHQRVADASGRYARGAVDEFTPLAERLSAVAAVLQTATQVYSGRTELRVYPDTFPQRVYRAS